MIDLCNRILCRLLKEKLHIHTEYKKKKIDFRGACVCMCGSMYLCVDVTMSGLGVSVWLVCLQCV